VQRGAIVVEDELPKIVVTLMDLSTPQKFSLWVISIFGSKRGTFCSVGLRL
jgi:hypothetical protein